MDEITGSTKHVREWNWWGSGQENLVTSSLERWIIEYEGGYTNDWDYVSGLHTSLIPLGKTFANGGAPEIHPLASSPEILDAYVAHAEIAEIQAFVKTMRSGTEEQRAKAVEQAIDRGLQFWAKS